MVGLGKAGDAGVVMRARRVGEWEGVLRVSARLLSIYDTENHLSCIPA